MRMKWHMLLIFLLAVGLALPAMAQTEGHPLPGDISREEALKIAGDTIAEKWQPEPELLNPEIWRLHLSFQHIKENPMTRYRQWNMWFEALNQRYSSYSLAIRHDGKVLEASRTPGTQDAGISPSQVQDQYTMIHGSMLGWDHETWTSFLKDLEKAMNTHWESGLTGNIGLFLQQEYAKPDEGMITKEKAVEIATGLPEAPAQVDRAVSGAVLLMDEGVPVWKVQLLPAASSGRRLPFLAEINARTGEVRGFRQVAGDDYRYRLYYVLDRLMPPQEAELPAPHPSPRPDGKPHYWYSPKAPDYFWEAMDRILAQGDLTDLIGKWEAEYGRDSLFWPLEAQVVYQMVDNMDFLEGTFPGLPGPEDIPQEQALVIAKQALLDQGMAQEELEALTPCYRFLFNQNFPGAREWMIDFCRMDGLSAQPVEVVTINAATGEVIAIGANG